MTTSLKQLKHLKELNESKISTKHSKETLKKMRKPHNVSTAGRLKLKAAGKKSGFMNKGKKKPPFSKAHREKISKANTGKKHPSRTKTWREKQSKAHKGLLMGEKNPNYGNHKPLTEEHRRKIKETANKPEVKEKQRIAALKRIKEKRGRVFKDTVPEKIYEKTLTDKNLIIGKDYLKQQLVGNITIDDFFLIKENKHVFIDGCYWHSCPIHFPKPIKSDLIRKKLKDKNDNIKMINNNYKFLRIWEHELKKP